MFNDERLKIALALQGPTVDRVDAVRMTNAVIDRAVESGDTTDLEALRHIFGSILTANEEAKCGNQQR